MKLINCYHKITSTEKDMLPYFTLLLLYAEFECKVLNYECTICNAVFAVILTLLPKLPTYTLITIYLFV